MALSLIMASDHAPCTLSDVVGNDGRMLNGGKKGMVALQAYTEAKLMTGNLLLPMRDIDH